MRQMYALAALSLMACANEGQLPEDENSEEPNSASQTEPDAAVLDGGSDSPATDAGPNEGFGDAAAQEAGAGALTPNLTPMLSGGLRTQLCPFYTDEPLDIIGQPIAVCGESTVPLFHDAPERGDIKIFLKIIPAEDQENLRGTLWLLMGGPGSPGAHLEHQAREIHDQFPTLDIIIPDHRGVGRSTYFECEDSRDNSGDWVSDCAAELDAEWGDDVAAFSITQGARDVLLMADKYRGGEREVILWGASYGATWAQRILQLDEQGIVKAAIMDSAATATPETTLADNMLKVAESGDTLFEACLADEQCTERLGPDAKARALAILADLCEPLNGEYRGRRWFQSMLSGAMRGWDSLRLVPPLIHRAGRCDDDDVRFIERFFREQSSSGGRSSYESAPRSTALLYTIIFSELVPSASTVEELRAAGETSVFADLVGAEDLAVGYDVWPTYPRDEYMFELADTETNLLILHGGLDTQTPPSMGRDMERHFTADNHQYFYFPLGTHGVYWGSHTADRPARFGPIDPNDRYSCGQHLAWQFLDDPGRPVDASCVESAPPIEFGTNADTLFDLAGHDDPWDNP